MIGCLLSDILCVEGSINQVCSIDARGPSRIREEADVKEKWLDCVAKIDVVATFQCRQTTVLMCAAQSDLIASFHLCNKVDTVNNMKVSK